MKLIIDLKIADIIRCVIGVLLIYAALGKLADPGAFFLQVKAYQFPLPDEFLAVGALALPWLELLLGFLLLFHVWTISVALLAGALFLLFTLVSGYAWLAGLEISCGCFNLNWFGLDNSGNAGQWLESPAFATFRNLLLTAAALGCVASCGTKVPQP